MAHRAQSLFAIVLISNFDLSVPEALLLAGTFLLQLFFPGTEVRVLMAIGYVVLGVGMLVMSPSRRSMVMQVPAMIREAINPPAPVTAGAEAAAPS